MHHVYFYIASSAGQGKVCNVLVMFLHKRNERNSSEIILVAAWPIGERGLPSNAVRQLVNLTKYGKPRGIPNANCKSTDVGWTGTPIKKLLTQTSNLGSDQTQSVRFTVLQSKESTKSKPCTQKGRAAPCSTAPRQIEGDGRASA